MQLIYTGKTPRCKPSVDFPDNWLIDYTPNHWSNEGTMLRYIDKIIVPFVKEKREELGLDENQPALAIFDHFNGQLTERVNDLLESHDIHSVLVPANCTDRLQPL